MNVGDSCAERCFADCALRTLTDERRTFTRRSSTLCPEWSDRLSGAELRVS